MRTQALLVMDENSGSLSKVVLFRASHGGAAVMFHVWTPCPTHPSVKQALHSCLDSEKDTNTFLGFHSLWNGTGGSYLG